MNQSTAQNKQEGRTMTILEAINKIEANTCFRMTAMCDDNSAFFVPVAKDGKAVIGECFRLTKPKILKLAKLER